MNAVVVRPARRRDAAVLVEMMRGLNQEIRSLGHKVEDKITKETLLTDGLKRDGWINALIAEIDDAPVGYSAWYRGYDVEEAVRQLRMADLYVRPAGRRRGVAQALVAALVALGRELGVGEIVWNVEPENAPSLAFYERIGARAWTRNRIMYLKLAEYRP